MEIAIRDDANCIIALFKGIESLHMVNGGTVSNFADAIMCLSMYEDITGQTGRSISTGEPTVVIHDDDSIEATAMQCVLSRESLSMLAEDMRTAQNSWDMAKVECFGTTDLPMQRHINNDIEAQIKDYQNAVDTALKELTETFPDVVSDNLLRSISQAYIESAEGEYTPEYPEYDV